MPHSKSRVWAGYALAIASVAICLAISLAAWDTFRAFPFMLFYVAVFMAARYGGVGPGSVAIGLSGLSAWYYLLDPRFSWRLAGGGEVLGLIGFVAVCTLIVVLTARVSSSQRRMRGVLESLPQGFATLDADGRFSYLNPRAAEMGGKRVGDLIGRSVDELFPEPARGPVVEALRQTLRDGVSRHAQTEHAGRWLDCAISPSDDGVTILLTDLTERREAAERRRRDEERLRLIMEAGQIGGWEWEIATDRVEWTPRIFQIHGIEPGAFGGTMEDFAAFVHPDDLPRFRDAIQGALAGQAYELEFRAVRPSGEIRWLHTRGHVVSEGGRPVRMIGATLDITDRVRDREEIRALENRFRFMADVAPVMIWLCDTNRLRTWFNRAWLEFTGRSMEQELGDGWKDDVHPEDLDRWLQTFQASFDSRQPFQVEYRLRRADGGYRWILAHGVPLYREGDDFTGYIGTCVDIHERKEAEQDRERLLGREREARSEAESANRLKDEFLATLSHELRTPLQAVLGWSRLLRSGEIEDAKRRQGLESIERSAAAQAQLIEDLLDMSRIVTGTIRLDVQPVDLKPVIEAAMETIRPAADAKSIQLHRVLDPLAGPVNGDPQRLQQVIWNLLSNAVKFTPRNGRVEVLLERVNSHVEITVSDSGEGIAPEFLPHVFDRFRQQDAGTTRKQHGLGLGLAIVRHLIELHGGAVRAKSAGAGQGATFVVSLPLSIVRQRGPMDPSRQQPVSASVDASLPAMDISLAGIRVLVVEDEEDSRDLLRTALECRGAEVVVAESGEQGLHFLEERTPDVIVSDIGMPEVDGYEFIRRVRKFPPERGGRVPAVALTAFARAEDRTRALVAGYQVHAAKPILPAELVAIVHSLSQAWTARSS